VPVGTAVRHALGRQSLFAEVFSSCWRGESAHANTTRVVADSLTQGVAGVKAPALLWATLVPPLRGLEAIFIRGGELEKIMGHFHENASFGSHADRFFPGGVGFWLLGRSPRFAATAVPNTLTVATPPIFIDRGDLNKSCGISLSIRERHYPHCWRLSYHLVIRVLAEPNGQQDIWPLK
jgi:hypothetical protein